MAIYPTKSSQLNYRKKVVGLGVSLISIFSILLILVSFDFFHIFNIIILGTFGLFFYPICLFFIVLGILIICKKPIKASRSVIVLSSFWLLVFLLILQLATSKNIDAGFGEYLTTTFKGNLTAGGVIFGVLLYPIHYLTHTVASYILLSVALVVITAFLIDRIRLDIIAKNSLKVTDADFSAPETDVAIDDEEMAQDSLEMQTEQIAEDEDNIFIADEEDDEKETAREILGFSTGKKRTIRDLDKIVEDSEKEDEEEVQTPQISTPNKPNIIVHDEGFDSFKNQIVENKQEKEEPKVDEKALKEEERRKAALDYLKISKGKFETKNMPKGLDNVEPHTDSTQNTSSTANDMQQQTQLNSSRLDKINQLSQKINSNESSGGLVAGVNPFAQKTNNDIYDENLTKSSFNQSMRDGQSSQPLRNNNVNNTQRPNTIIPNFIPAKAKEAYSGEANENIVEPTGPRVTQQHMNEVFAKPRTPDKKIYTKPPDYVRPPLDLLRTYPTDIELDQEYIAEKGKVIVDTLKAFRIETKVINATKGPTFTRFELQMAPGIPASAVTNKIDNLSMALESNCRLQVPIPGKNAFGVEVPNKKRMKVGLREILESSNFQESKSPLTFALGKNISGDCKVGCIDKMVHTLVAGATGSGKSICLNALLISLLYKASPEDVKLLLVDPKFVEFRAYAGSPHMLIPNTITDCDKAVDALSWLVTEMDNRYQKLNALGVKKISEYNETTEVKTGAVPKMYYIVMVFDEVNDFMTRAKKEIEEKIRLLAAKSRACGIHLILATQRPTVDVITGTIKANLPSRIGLTVGTAIDSKTILDAQGAETLLGYGDMLFLPFGSNDMERIQGCLIENDEVDNVIRFVKENNECHFDETIEDAMFNKHDDFDPTSHGAEEAFDPMLKSCLKYFIKAKKASASSLQGYFGIGYPKANKIVLQMEKAGFVSPGDSNGRRVLYITAQEFEERFGEGIDE